MALAAKRTEAGTIAAEQAFRGLSRDASVLWAGSLDALAVVDDERRYVRVNERTERLLGAPADRILRSRLEHFTPRQYWPQLLRSWRELHQRGRLYGDGEVLRNDGSLIAIEFCAVRGFRPGEHLIVARETEAKRATAPAARRNGSAAANAPRLTRRETEVIALVADGNSAREIGARLALSPATIKTHLASIYHKLGVRDRAAAVAIALRSGIIS